MENSVDILKARRQALIQEFLRTAHPFLRSREDIRQIYGRALDELALSVGHEGTPFIQSIVLNAERDMSVHITEKSIWGLKYKDIIIKDRPVRTPDQRGYDYLSTTHHLEEAIYLFEKVLESMLELAAFENKLKRLGDEIVNVTRKIKVLEERIMPDLTDKIHAISQYLSERDREAFYRLKKFKGPSRKDREISRNSVI